MKTNLKWFHSEEIFRFLKPTFGIETTFDRNRIL